MSTQANQFSQNVVDMLHAQITSTEYDNHTLEAAIASAEASVDDGVMVVEVVFHDASMLVLRVTGNEIVVVS